MASDPQQPYTTDVVSTLDAAAWQSGQDAPSLDVEPRKTAAAQGSISAGTAIGETTDAIRQWAKTPGSWGNSPRTTGTSIEFRVRHVDQPTRRLRLSGARYTIGNGIGCSIRLDDESLRPLHAVLIRDRERLLIRAYSVPFQVNESRVTEATLQTGDRITLGGYEFELLKNDVNPLNAVSKAVAQVDIGSIGAAGDEASSMGLVTSMTSDNETWQQNFHEEAKKWRSLKKDVERRDAWCRSREQELLDKQRQLDELMQAMQDREEELATQESAAVEVHEEFQLRYSDLQRQHDELLLQQDELSTGREHLRLQQDRLDGRDRLHRQQIDQLIAEQQHSKERESLYQEELAESEARLHASQVQAEKASLAVDQMREKFASLNEQLLALGEQQETLQTLESQRNDEHRLKLADLVRARDEAMTQRDTIVTERDAAIDSKAASDALLERSQERCAELESSESKLLLEIQDLRTEIASTRAQAETLDADCQAAKASISQLEETLSETRARHESDHESWSGEVDTLRQNVEDLSVELANAQKQISDLTEQNEKLAEQLTMSDEARTAAEEARAEAEEQRDQAEEQRVNANELTEKAKQELNEETKRRQEIEIAKQSLREQRDEAEQQRATADELAEKAKQELDEEAKRRQQSEQAQQSLREQRDQARADAENTRALYDRANHDHGDTLDEIERLEQETRELVGSQDPSAPARSHLSMQSSETSTPQLSLMSSDAVDESAHEDDAVMWSNEVETAEALEAETSSLDAGDAQQSTSEIDEVAEIEAADSQSTDLPSELSQSSELSQPSEPSAGDEEDAWPTYQLQNQPEPELLPSDLSSSLELSEAMGLSDQPAVSDDAVTASKSDTSIAWNTPNEPAQSTTSEESIDIRPEDFDRRQEEYPAAADSLAPVSSEAMPAWPSEESSHLLPHERDPQPLASTGWQTPDPEPEYRAEETNTNYEVASSESYDHNSPYQSASIDDVPQSDTSLSNAIDQTESHTTGSSSDSGFESSDFASQINHYDELADVSTGSLADQLINDLQNEREMQTSRSAPDVDSHNYQDEEPPAQEAIDPHYSAPEGLDSLPAQVEQTAMLPDALEAPTANDYSGDSDFSNTANLADAPTSSLGLASSFGLNVEALETEPSHDHTSDFDPNSLNQNAGFADEPAFQGTDGAQEPQASGFSEASAVEDSAFVHASDAVEAEESAPEPVAELPPADAPSVAPANTGDAPDDDSIEAYMNRLLQRVQGEPDEEGTATAKSAPVQAPTPRSPLAPQQESFKNPASEAVTDSLENVADSEVVTSADPNTPLVPRSQAPERNSDLSAMRQLANDSARSAISRSQKTQSASTRTRALWNFVYAGIALLCALALVAWLEGQFALKAIAVCAALIFAGVCVKEGLGQLTEAIRKSGMAPDEPEEQPAE